jgi:hypothetical protein
MRMLIIYLLGLYVAAGLLVGLAFVTAGASKVLDGQPSISAGTRALLLPASILLWPLIVKRWLGARAAS